jgi:hypothetical protein
MPTVGFEKINKLKQYLMGLGGRGICGSCSVIRENRDIYVVGSCFSAHSMDRSASSHGRSMGCKYRPPGTGLLSEPFAKVLIKVMLSQLLKVSASPLQMRVLMLFGRVGQERFERA